MGPQNDGGDIDNDDGGCGHDYGEIVDDDLENDRYNGEIVCRENE